MIKIDMTHLLILLFEFILLANINTAVGKNYVPYLNLNPDVRFSSNSVINGDFKTKREPRDKSPTDYLPFEMLIDKDRDKDTSEYWRETEILSLVRNKGLNKDLERCEENPEASVLHLASRRTVRPICKSAIDHQLCPQCPRFSNFTECELFRDSCRERRVKPSEYRYYCDQKYGKYRTMFIPADYSECRCCDECVPYRELDQSCVDDEYNFDIDEFLPVTTIDFRAGCNPYWGHPDQELKALRCHQELRRCVPVNIPMLPNETITQMNRRNYRFEPLTNKDCPASCRGYSCYGGLVSEQQCAAGAFLPRSDHCNCCGTCSSYQQLNQKCANFKRSVQVENNKTEIEVEEEFLEPGCDDGLVCRQGYCQDIHDIEPDVGSGRRKRDERLLANEPCKKEMKYFKKKYGEDGHLHFNAPQCTPLWLYGAVQCRRFVCYCALEDGTFIQGIKVPRVEVSHMNCDCAREKCRTDSSLECDGYGNYKEAIFITHTDDWPDAINNTEQDAGSQSPPTGAPRRTFRAGAASEASTQATTTTSSPKETH